MCDFEQMFHSFHDDPEHRDFLHFLWYEDNTPSKQIMEYQMNVHLFGNGPSPAVAMFGLRETAADGKEEFGEMQPNLCTVTSMLTTAWHHGPLPEKHSILSPRLRTTWSSWERSSKNATPPQCQ